MQAVDPLGTNGVPVEIQVAVIEGLDTISALQSQRARLADRRRSLLRTQPLNKQSWGEARIPISPSAQPSASGRDGKQILGGGRGPFVLEPVMHGAPTTSCGTCPRRCRSRLSPTNWGTPVRPRRIGLSASTTRLGFTAAEAVGQARAVGVID
jgi:hypothetical protein